MGTFGLQALTLVTGIIIARMLGVEGRGQIALVFALGLLASQLTLGSSLPNAIAKGLAERGLAARDGLRRIARRRAYWLAVPCLASALVMLLLGSSASADVREQYGLAVAVFVMTLQTMLFRVLVGALQGEVGHLGRMALVAMTPQFLFAVALTLSWLVGWDWGVVEVLLAFFVASLIGLVVGYASLAKPSFREQDALDEAELWTVSRQAYVSSVRPLDSVGLDRLLVGGLLGISSLGLYAAAAAVSNLCRIVGNAVSVIVLPRVAMAHADLAAQRTIIRRWLSLSIVLIAMVVLGFELVVASVIRLAFGEEFVGAIEVARWLVLADGLFGFRSVLISVLQGQGRSKTASWIELALTPVLIGGIVQSAASDSLVGIGYTTVAVGAASCLALGIALARRPAGKHRYSRGAVSRERTSVER